MPLEHVSTPGQPQADKLYETPILSLARTFRQQVFIFDNNILPKLRNPPRDGRNLGDLLDALRAPSRHSEGVVLLPAVAEANYRRPGGVSARELVQLHQEWSQEHFGVHGQPEIWLFAADRDGFLPFKALFEVFFRVVSNYWVLCNAQMALRRFPRDAQRREALSWFFDSVAALGQAPSTKFPFLAAASAVIGNSNGRGSLHVRDGSPKQLMNGSWDLLYWDYFVQMYVKSDRSGQLPRFFSYDPKAVGMFSNIEPRPNGSLYFSYGSDRQSEHENQLLQERVAVLTGASTSHEAFLAGIHETLPTQYHHPHYFLARRLFHECVGHCPALVDTWLWSFAERKYGRA